MMYETEEARYAEPEEFCSAAFVPTANPQYFRLLKREKENAGLTSIDIISSLIPAPQGAGLQQRVELFAHAKTSEIFAVLEDVIPPTLCFTAKSRRLFACARSKTSCCICCLKTAVFNVDKITLLLPESTKDRFSPTTCLWTCSDREEYYIIINPQRLAEIGKSPGAAIREQLDSIKYHRENLTANT